jgi:hypothetical protein
MLKGKKPWITLLNAAPARGVVQVDPAMGAQSTTFGSTKRLKR